MDIPYAPDDISEDRHAVLVRMTHMHSSYQLAYALQVSDHQRKQALMLASQERDRSNALGVALHTAAAFVQRTRTSVIGKEHNADEVLAAIEKTLKECAKDADQ